jgi:hypothetical protein
MKNESRESFGPTTQLTPGILYKLKNKGFRYVQVIGFTSDKRPDYMEPRYFMLVPVKDLPGNQQQKGIYEPIDSKFLLDWASTPNEGVEVLIAAGRKG